MSETMNPKYQEILHLEEALREAGIPHRIERSMDGWRIRYPAEGKCVCSAIEHELSSGSNRDRIEILGLLNGEERKFGQMVGHLTAENVFMRIKNDWERRKGK